MKQPKVLKALKYLETHPGATAYEAAKHAGVSATNVYKRVKVDQAKKAGLCPHCGAKMPQYDSAIRYAKDKQDGDQT